jgi:hypothetical protein
VVFELDRVFVWSGLWPPAQTSTRGVGEYTAMHGAAENGLLEIVRLLAERGAGLRARADTGETPLALAEAAGQHAAVALLLSLGAKRAEPDAAPDRRA